MAETKTRKLTAADMLDCKHPLHKSFMADCLKRNAEPTKRQARKFLQKYPQYRELTIEVS